MHVASGCPGASAPAERPHLASAISSSSAIARPVKEKTPVTTSSYESTDGSAAITSLAISPA